MKKLLIVFMLSTNMLFATPRERQFPGWGGGWWDDFDIPGASLDSVVFFILMYAFVLILAMKLDYHGKENKHK